jgi:ribokinase
MLVALGSDSFATPIEESLRGAQVALEIVRSKSEPTGTAFICVSADGENAITVAPGANFELRPEHLPALNNVSHLLMQLEIPLPTVIAYANTARSSGVCVVLNAAPAQELPAELLSQIDVLVVNQGELATLAHHAGSIAQGMESLNIPTVVVTLGSRGCCVRHLGHYFFQPAFHVSTVDTTAAGDTCCGCLTAALSLGSGMADALRIASAAGALACTRLGAQSSIPTKAEIDTFLAAQADFPLETIRALRNFCGLD